jgi:hypothetical protein
MQEPLNEELLEQLYWEFDSERKRGNRSERDVFKGKMRHFATHGRNPTLPWWRKDKDGWPITTWEGRPVASFTRILCQNIRKITG